MWIYDKNFFCSVVETGENLMVRFRSKEHAIKFVKIAGIEKDKIIITEDSDYRFRVIMGRNDFADLMYQEIMKIDYTNFKNAAHDRGISTKESNAMFGVWRAMAEYQER
jgi:hypothetical protein